VSVPGPASAGQIREMRALARRISRTGAAHEAAKNEAAAWARAHVGQVAKTDMARHLGIDRAKTLTRWLKDTTRETTP